jgi:peptidoglycan/LPS O-acetylase OafA/YrhL
LRIFSGVQAMRGFAALSVVCGHAVTARPDLVAKDAAEGALTILASGVDIFFVISGFIIATTAASQPNALNFAFRRIVRIYPVYWLVLLAALVSSYWIALAPGVRPPLDLGLIFAWRYPNWYIGPAWSIAFELHFYAAIAVLLAIAPNRLFELLFAAFSVAMLAIIFHLPLGLYSDPLVLEFAAGVGIAYQLRIRGELPVSQFILPVSAALFAAGWYWIFIHGSSDPQLARVPTYGLGAACLIYAVVAAELNGAAFPRLLQWLGGISYSLYVIHYPLIKWIATFTDLWLASPTVTIIASILLSIGLAAVVNMLVEKPTLSWGRRLSLRRRGSEALPTSPQAQSGRRHAAAAGRPPQAIAGPAGVRRRLNAASSTKSRSIRSSPPDEGQIEQERQPQR